MEMSLSGVEQSALFAAIAQSRAIIIFDADGTILSANDKFMAIMGYGPEIIGQRHSLFVHPDDKYTGAYERFWERLRSGGFHSGEFRRLGRNHQELWLSAIYSPIVDDEGKVTKIIKFARDVTAEKRAAADAENQVRAINRSHAVIEFDLHGIITHANDNFLKITGYALTEIVGQHHAMFLDPAEAASETYKNFWQELAIGRHHSGEFERIGKGGKPFWIRAAYNPIIDPEGHPTGVIKYALDITEDIKRRQAHERAAAASETLLRDILDQVGGVAGDIDAITRQTRLLALNARIEAARVGEAGRSFAVVASEISGLSGRTAEATNHIAKLILNGDQQSRKVLSLFGAAREQEREATLALGAARR
jgi:methyl-accepting chemotaxis protein